MDFVSWTPTIIHNLASNGCLSSAFEKGLDTGGCLVDLDRVGLMFDSIDRKDGFNVGTKVGNLVLQH